VANGDAVVQRAADRVSGGAWTSSLDRDVDVAEAYTCGVPVEHLGHYASESRFDGHAVW
jgi:hypothetical protein